MKAKKIRELSDKDISTKLEEAREEVRIQRFKFSVEKNLENPKKIRDTKKNIARLLTVRNERKSSSEATK